MIYDDCGQLLTVVPSLSAEYAFTPLKLRYGSLTPYTTYSPPLLIIWRTAQLTRLHDLFYSSFRYRFTENLKVSFAAPSKAQRLVIPYASPAFKS